MVCIVNSYHGVGYRFSDIILQNHTCIEMKLQNTIQPKNERKREREEKEKESSNRQSKKKIYITQGTNITLIVNSYSSEKAKNSKTEI